MNTAREQAREAAVEHLGNERTPFRQEALWAADAASDVWEPLVRKLTDALSDAMCKATFTETGHPLDHGQEDLDETVAKVNAVLVEAEEALGDA